MKFAILISNRSNILLVRNLFLNLLFLLFLVLDCKKSEKF